MMFNYPNGKKYTATSPLPQQLGRPRRTVESYGNRGMTLEDDLNETNLYYLSRGIAVIHKKPVPIQIVQVDYPKRSAAVIKEAYFKQASTTDYNGVYKGRYIDFEAKETQNTSSFPLKNFHDHQIHHMEAVLKQGGIAFVILRFSSTDEYFLLDAGPLLKFWERMELGGRKSITKNEILETGIPIPFGFQPRIDYLKTVDELYDLSE
ncbi:Holliday junction resolvase RecU [Bacillus sp. FJAT-27225]|uniref:Holliday junction resolvase RecU n=1 Tax=Bacillus sp. FJAT-27225 TaxID=1743144 RepID=UPI00080C22A2|nr:Holliday junction resolvase RecU [Bacillus sp. FJAT-27225]OCA91539.1 Holliday junction resolvase RecU [Bacillus sp. FJAT-27225]